MGNTIVKTQIEEVREFLSATVVKLEGFLNGTTLEGLKQGQPADEEYYKSILSSLRKLAVYCEEGLDACKVILQAEVFSKPAAEKTLYRIYYQCIEEFFSPKNDAWYEDSRSAYTGKNAIKFRQPVAAELSDLLVSLESGFQRIREELEYYETDYRTKMLQSR
ncbi:YpuI family protein [Mesobacillus sp. AQ2]|uniref:YpuI family protein n=1 Tax=Bacillaceae TaxID=186817 RepID=UPI0011A1FB7F|nr:MULTISPECIES: YpuI family protein [Bacillaceae]MCM3122256.1 YpuI family protein [Mesobacillus sp. MER 33]MCM3232220.1 YpuI family protein [Mesobacillus sp. MER 48]WHX39167.1 YpuI family protein [Mesobacillus sp. AQ2]